jgi:DNA-binding NtrC family response regulator
MLGGRPVGDDRKHVLVIEDNPSDARLLGALLDEAQQEDIKLITTENIADALRYVEQVIFDVILTDLNLPDCTGLDTFLRLRTAAPYVPIVVLTGLSEERIALLAMKYGAQDYIIKGTMDGMQLARVIRFAIERKTLEVEREDRIRELERVVVGSAALSGLIHVCTTCSRVRDESGIWKTLEAYLAERTSAKVSRDICPSCVESKGGIRRA